MLDPRVYCVLNPRNRGAGIADLGLFSEEQVGAAVASAGPWEQQVPSRGVVEAKGVDKDLMEVASSPQVTRYARKYGQVLITNLWSFAVVTLGTDGRAVMSETFDLAPNAESFWRLTDTHGSVSHTVADELVAFLMDTLSRRAPVTGPEHLAWFLASYARIALNRVQQRGLSGLASLRQDLQRALGVTYSGDRAERFFRSTLVQTLFYGVFSVWVLWTRDRDASDDAFFDWRLAGWELDVPVVSVLFDRVSSPGDVRGLGLVELLDLAGQALNRVDRARFFSQFEFDHAIEYFYEPFLAAFDPDLRKELGVWYTPAEVVQYMVGRVDETLREEFGLPDGLADESVIVLDPCVGTGSFLIEAVRRIHSTLIERAGDDALVPLEVKRAVTSRLFGFEILPAPFVVAHLQLGLLLRAIGAPLYVGRHDHGERAGVLLTNALTGWSEPTEEPERLFPELEREREAADEVKRRQKILVVIGNPPYNAFAGVSPEEEGGLVEPYKVTVRTRNTLDDLYVRFFRVAERRIVEQTGQGIVCLISNSSFLARPSFEGMRLHLLRGFNKIHVDNLNGDRDETGKRTPDGRPDPSVFSTARNRAGIAEGVAITTLVRLAHGTFDGQGTRMADLTYRDFWGGTKRADLVRASGGLPPSDPASSSIPVGVSPSSNTLWALRPISAGSDYYSWPVIPELAADSPTYGLHEARGGCLIDMDKARLATRMSIYLDPEVAYDDLPATVECLRRPWYGFDAQTTRRQLTGMDVSRGDRRRPYSASKVKRFVFKPFDVRHAYVETQANLWVASQPGLVRAAEADAAFLYVRRTAEAADDGVPAFLSPYIGDQHALHKTAYLIPTVIASPRVDNLSSESLALQFEADEVVDGRANLSGTARRYLSVLGLPDPDRDSDTRMAIWHHVLAVVFAPAYAMDNREAIRQEYPRVPLPANRDAFLESARIGRRVAGLLDIDLVQREHREVRLRPAVAQMATLRKATGSLDTSMGDLELRAGWGYLNANRATMAGRGRITRRGRTPDEQAALQAEARLRGLDEQRVYTLLSDEVVDVHLNETVMWTNIPRTVWDFRIGGFQVLKKWLSYRERGVLGRGLAVDEARQFTEIARRLATLLLLGPELNMNYVRASESVWSWPETGSNQT